MPKAENPSPLNRVAAEPALQYRFGGRLNTIDDYLARQRVTGLLVIKDDQVLVERYQYDRKPTDRLTSNSMAKSRDVPGGGILVHGIPGLHGWIEGLPKDAAVGPGIGGMFRLAMSLLLDAVMGFVAGALALAATRGAQRVLRR